MSPTAPDPGADPLVIGGARFRSRLFVGTGKYKSVEETRDALDASGAEVVTVALRRVNLADRSEGSLGKLLLSGRYTILPNTAGCYSADEAVRTLFLVGADDVADKPYNPDRLISIVTEMFESFARDDS